MWKKETTVKQDYDGGIHAKRLDTWAGGSMTTRREIKKIWITFKNQF